MSLIVDKNVTPTADREIKDVIAKDKNGELIKITKGLDNEYIFTMPESSVSLSVVMDYKVRIVMQINNKTIIVNGENMIYDVAPFIVDDRTLVPIRIITELFGGEVDWDNDTRTVSLIIDDKVLSMTIGKEIPGYGTSAIIVDNRTFVPVRYVMEMLDSEVEWIEESRQIIITK